MSCISFCWFFFRFFEIALVKKGPGSWRDPAGNLAGIPARFWPAGFSAGNEIPGGQNLAGNLGGILSGKLNSWRPKSRRESCRESRREAKFPAAKILPRISAGSEIPGNHNLAGNLAKSRQEEKFPVDKILTRFMARIPARFLVTENFYPRRDSWQEFWQD